MTHSCVLYQHSLNTNVCIVVFLQYSKDQAEMLTSFSSLALTAASWFCLCSFAPAQNLHWQRISDGNGGPPARRGSAIAWTPQALYLFGGEGSDGVLGKKSLFFSLY